ncbi:hypothetical protein RV10_GL003042 [Enterococcus pallens]|nr:hypothetical protein RV10_GL003042 [Enterococcus pallens]
MENVIPKPAKKLVVSHYTFEAEISKAFIKVRNAVVDDV